MRPNGFNCKLGFRVSGGWEGCGVSVVGDEADRLSANQTHWERGQTPVIGWACNVLEGGVMAENEQSGFHEGVTIPVRPVGAGGSLLQAGEGEHGERGVGGPAVS